MNSTIFESQRNMGKYEMVGSITYSVGSVAATVGRGKGPSGLAQGLPPQGWLLARPGGPGCPSVCQRLARGTCGPRCFACGDKLIPPPAQHQAQAAGAPGSFVPVEAAKVKAGDRVLVAATLKPAVVAHVVNGAGQPRDGKKPEAGLWARLTPKERAESRAADEDVVVVCRLADLGGGGVDDEEEELVGYLCEDLVQAGEPGKEGGAGSVADEQRVVGGLPRDRREVLLLHGGDAAAARAAWAAAAPRFFEPPGASFASCVRGHLLHARCFQGALVGGTGCPACDEALWVPGVERVRDPGAGDDCGHDGGGEALADAFAAAGAVEEKAGKARAEGLSASSRDKMPTVLDGKALKMCPACFAGPLYNTACADMRAHHGQCQKCSTKIPNADAVIAKALASKKSDQTVGDVIPKCGKCKVQVMFNGCQACGHLFAGSGDSEWNRMPVWDPEAMAALELDAQVREAARMLASQVRYEAALLDYEKRALAEARAGRSAALGGSGGGSGGGEVDPMFDEHLKALGEMGFEQEVAREALGRFPGNLNRAMDWAIAQAPASAAGKGKGSMAVALDTRGAVVPPRRKAREAQRWVPATPPTPAGCDGSCTTSHSGQGNCLICGEGWGSHSGHNCSGGRGRGSWPV